jgi:HAE1 family hydrophobic/amphiphilic exporter-1
MAAQDPRLIRVRPNGMEDVPEYRINVDWEKAGALGVPITAIHNTIAAAFGSAYVNDFIQAGRVKRVFVQADAPYRMLPKDLEKLYVRNTTGKMVTFSSFSFGHWTYGSPKLERYNGFPSINIWGEPAPGRSSGEAMQAMEEIVSKLPKGIGCGLPLPGGPLRELAHSYRDSIDPAPWGHRRRYRFEHAGDAQ